VHRVLIHVLAKREIIGRYRGSILGLLWSFFNPLLMLAVYTFVFSVVFQSRWGRGAGTGSGSRAEFALALFSGLIMFNVFSECFNKAPVLIVGSVNYVKKVVFPIEILPVVSLVSASFHALIGLVVWLIFDTIVYGVPHWTIVLLPVVAFPLLALTLGLSWFIASLGVYLRDVSQIIGVLTTVLMFMTPIFYPIESLPPAYRPALQSNPLAIMIDQARDVMIWGRIPDWSQWLLVTSIGVFIACLGFAWFQATRKGFADVL
jgi:lipopolysaccharide transport system permease protein